MFENDISELAVSFEQWTEFEFRLQQSLVEMELSGSIQSIDFTFEIKQVYASTAKATKSIEKVLSLHVIL